MINDAGKHEVKNRRAITAAGTIRVHCFCHDRIATTKKILARESCFEPTARRMKALAS
jgi:hypothetical protein